MILMYHKVAATAPTQWWVEAAAFYAQMLALQNRIVVYLDDYEPNNSRHVVITFDGVYENVLHYAAPILRHFGYPFELFVTSAYIGRDNTFDFGEPECAFASEQSLLKLAEAGGRLQWHGERHIKLTHSRTASDWEQGVRELTVPKYLQSLDPTGFKWLAFPHGEFSPDIYDEVKNRFSGALSCHQGDDVDRYKLNRITVTNSSKLGESTLCAIVVSHNYGSYLSEAVESVLQQTRLPDSILIVDDASADNTAEIGSRYAELHPDLIRFIRNDTRLGIVGTFNRAVALTESSYVCFLGADNKLASNYFEMTTTLLERGPESLAIAYTDFLLFGPNAQEEYLRHDVSRRGRIIEGKLFEVRFPDFTFDALGKGNFIHGSSVYRRSAFDVVGGYFDAGNRPEDANLFRRMIAAGYSASRAKDTWLEYRQHSDHQANVISRIRGELDFYRVYAKRLELKVQTLEKTFGLLSPLIKALSSFERLCFDVSVRAVRYWRRRFKP